MPTPRPKPLTEVQQLILYMTRRAINKNKTRLRGPGICDVQQLHTFILNNRVAYPCHTDAAQAWLRSLSTRTRVLAPKGGFNGARATGRRGGAVPLGF